MGLGLAENGPKAELSQPGLELGLNLSLEGGHQWKYSSAQLGPRLGNNGKIDKIREIRK